MKTMFEQVQNALTDIEDALASTPALGDSAMAIRVIGEFSAGKTRFVTEMLRDVIPQHLTPISSLEVQTHIPLEITYGETSSLQLVRRACDDDEAQVIRNFNAFPERDEVATENPGEVRLRLAVPEPRLTLADGDSMYEDDTQAKRLFLIDMPGWNSEDDAAGAGGLGLSEDWMNLALVYVCPVNRLDSSVNKRQLEFFLQALDGGVLFRARDRLPVLFVITKCPEEERARREREQHERIDAILHNSANASNFIIKVVAVDFDTIQSGELVAMRDEFWHHVLMESPSPPLKHDNIEHAISKWPKSCDLRPYFAECIRTLNSLAVHFDKVRDHGCYMGGRTMAFFEGLDAPGMVRRAKTLWYRQLGAEGGLQDITSRALPPLPVEHPLTPWLQTYWQPRIGRLFESMMDFFVLADKVLAHLNPGIVDLEAWLRDHLDNLCGSASRALTGSFKKLCSVIEILPDDMPDVQRLSTILALSLIESRYDDTTKRCTRILNTMNTINGKNGKDLYGCT